MRCAPHGGQETELGKERTAGASIVGFLEVFFFFLEKPNLDNSSPRYLYLSRAWQSCWFNTSIFNGLMTSCRLESQRRWSAPAQPEQDH